MKPFYVLAIVPGALTGCGTYTPREVANPPTITVQQALNDVGDGLNGLRAKTNGKYGLIVDEVNVSFNISSKATSDGKLGITTDKIPIGGGGLLGVTASQDLANESNRGNQISIKLKNIATADLKGNDTLIKRCLQHPDDCTVLFSKPVTGVVK
ncbi:hypothetical protein MesoLj113a_32170 [Mesorhizobium sp. 113-1-2]|uniref:hypothetical protein n=1 Tax=Mesorhizobium sp. 113-1-2 TaxID=2744515 RepID=UPI0019269801|nr:hypothetical protein [Mesorhizobium sp. 113-1-2]BCG72059.1 hypothetical protein MesoLj113a_32170 [Mesorhizobium sp. 113-1-2]